MVSDYFEYRATEQIWIVDFEFWGGGNDANVAAAGLQGCIMNLFDPTKRFTFYQSYEMSLADMNAKFALALPQGHAFYSGIQAITAKRIYSDTDPRDYMTVPQIRTVMKKLGFQHKDALVLYWSLNHINLYCMARIFHDDPQLVMTLQQLKPTFKGFSVMQFSRYALNLPIFQLQVAYKLVHPQGRLINFHSADTDSFALWELSERMRPIVEGRKDEDML
jgi:hypothetical protein